MTDNDKPAAPAEPCCCEWFTCDKPCSPRADRFKQAWLAAIDEAQPIDVAAPAAPAPDADKAKIAAAVPCNAINGPMRPWSLVAAQVREIAELRAQLAEARAERDDWKRLAENWTACADAARQPTEFYEKYNEGTMRAMQALMFRAEAERDALRADAERYRWLRPRLYSIDFYYRVERTSVIAFEAPQNQPLGPGIQLDAAIDAARNEKP